VPKEMDSRPLGPLLAGRASSHREYVLSGLNRWRMVWDGRYKLVTGFAEDAPLLFDLERDPLENENRAPAEPGQLKRLHAMLA
jgi:arylsulfatase A-like enzyme